MKGGGGGRPMTDWDLIMLPEGQGEASKNYMKRGQNIDGHCDSMKESA